ncbi:MULTISPECIES: 4'-phosphopantetheinyl transferase family protein [Micromonospora]|uniref:4'-phosphopantetheinyl transferase n=1 Tax=Micromonospora yangpuensis TaxID=683228 RepID=A0A1C6UP11_9ACTN|nr:4'-phosphopantetheinyl transferase superfamily protein [Micromonospora yangpuensis]GGM08912.1 hypothetical protein GCM10012279_28730 [Micromonospora yangpuensis]SCL55718.1 4'-phosphopantetheinyl transferase [Micromonospora yangpuensis]
MPGWPDPTRAGDPPVAALSGPRAGTGPGPPPGADIWHIGLDVEPEVVRLVTELLDADERRRAAGMRDPVAGMRYVLAHAAVRTVLGGYLGTCGYTLHWARGPNGKPYFDGRWRRWQWSLSRSGGHALLAVCLTDPVGVDLEQIRDGDPVPALATRFLPAEEAAAVLGQPDPAGRHAAYHRLLSRKEACVKASGGRFLEGLRLGVLMSGDAATGGVAAGPGQVTGTGALAGQRWMLRDLPAPPGYVAALATTGTRLGRLRMFEWDWRQPHHRREDAGRLRRSREDAGRLPDEPPNPPPAETYRSVRGSPVIASGPRESQ